MNHSLMPPLMIPHPDDLEQNEEHDKLNEKLGNFVRDNKELLCYTQLDHPSRENN